MTAHSTLSATAADLLKRELKNHQERFEARLENLQFVIDPRTLNWLLDTMLDMVAEQHDRPVHALAPSIRRLILETECVDDNGDHLEMPGQQDQVDQVVEVFIVALEEVRQIGLSRGEWSEVPTPPLMFG